MEKGKGAARRWAVDFSDLSSSSHTTVADPPGFARSTPDLVLPIPLSVSLSLSDSRTHTERMPSICVPFRYISTAGKCATDWSLNRRSLIFVS